MARSRLPLRFADVLCLDFVNTADYHTTDRPVEYLVDAGVLVDWAVDAGAADAELAAGVHAWVARHPERAAAQLAGLLARREALYRVLLARLPSRGWPPATAGDLLTGGDLERLGLCDDPECGGLFLDTSKNHSRRWCSMALCGNAAKSRRHAARVRAARGR